MNFTVYFSENGLPKTGLSPTFTIIKVSDQVAIATNAAMTAEIGLGFYYYAIATDADEEYVALADSVTLTGGERYAPCITEVQGAVAQVKSDTTILKLTDIDQTFLLESIEITVNATEIDVEFIKAIEGGRWDIVGNKMNFYGSDNTTIVAVFTLYGTAPNYTQRTRD